ncbi:MAG: cell division protein FtsZ [Chloroflexota bacterium]|nr:cell division protein FtsZ [Chloroflexota bacterium]
MQPMSHDEAHKHERTQGQWAGMAHETPEEYEEQAHQWAILRHEVEVEDMKQQDEREHSGWEPRDTEEDAISPQAPFESPEDEEEQHVDIVVVGVGGGGMNAINRMMSARVRGVRFVVMNTDAQVLDLSEAQQRICLGQHYTKGLGAGGNAAVGMRAATESAAEIRAALGDANLVFIAAGMGGGTGTGAAPVVASIAKKLGALTVGIVTIPFTFEGTRRRRIAQDGLRELSAEVDALITVPNDRLLLAQVRDRSLAEAFKVADDVLRQGVQGIAEVINVPGLVNVDFADVRSVLRGAGSALMSIGQGKGRNRAQLAAQEAIAGGFLNVTIRGAKRVLFNISGCEDMTLFEVNEVAECIGAAVDDSADITFGAVIDPSLGDSIRVTLIAAGMEDVASAQSPGIHTAMHSGPARSTPASTAPASASVRPRPTSPPVTPITPVPPAIRSSTPKEQPAAPPPAGNTPGRAGQGTPERPQRSLEDLRGLRSLGRRHEQNSQPGADDEIEPPPFFKRFRR